MASFKTNFGAMAAYYGSSDTATTWPAILGGSAGPHAFLAGINGTFLSGAALSNLPRRVVGSYSNVSTAADQIARTSSGGKQTPAQIGPVMGSIPLNSPSKPY